MEQATSRRFRFLPLTIRLETLGGVATPLALRGTPLPATRHETFSTASENQKAIELKLLLGESPLAQNNLVLGTFHLRDLPPAKRGVPQINVAFSVDDSCRVTARATLEGTKLLAEQKFDPPKEFSDEFVANAIASAEKNRVTDETTLRQIEAVNRANELIARSEERLKTGANSRLSAAIADLGLALESDDSEKIREKGDALDKCLSDASLDDIFGRAFRTPFAFANRSQPATPKAVPPKSKATPRQELTSSSRTQALGKIFGGGTFTLNPQLCFVLMPFAEKFQPIYDDHIQPTVKRTGLQCERADEIRGPNLISWDIWERVNRARFLVAELTDQNPNVFYELGLAHAISKDVILLTQSMDFVPFDLKALRCICYEFTPRGMQKLEESLFETIQTLIKVG